MGILPLISGQVKAESQIICGRSWTGAGSVAQLFVACHERRLRLSACQRATPFGLRLSARRLSGAFSASQQGLALLQFHRRAGLFELGLEGVGVLAAQGLLDGVGGLVDEGLRLLQAEACSCPDDLYDLDLLLAGALEHDVELGLLLFGGGSAIACRASGRGCCYGCGGDAEALLQGLHQFRELENCHVLDRLHQFFFVECHRWSSYLCLTTTVLCSASARRSGRAPLPDPGRCC